MKNLAGNKECDKMIIRELGEAGITVFHGINSRGEVPYSAIGVLGEWYDAKKIEKKVQAFPPLKKLIQADDMKRYFKYTFVRAWYYWVATGPIPLSVARLLYNNPVGKKNIRVAGHCGCPPPDKEKDGVLLWAGPYEGPYDEEGAAVYTYHIDSQEGLNLFIGTIKEYGLDKLKRRFKFA